MFPVLDVSVSDRMSYKDDKKRILCVGYANSEGITVYPIHPDKYNIDFNDRSCKLLFLSKLTYPDGTPIINRYENEWLELVSRNNGKPNWQNLFQGLSSPLFVLGYYQFVLPVIEGCFPELYDVLKRLRVVDLTMLLHKLLHTGRISSSDLQNTENYYGNVFLKGDLRYIKGYSLASMGRRLFSMEIPEIYEMTLEERLRHTRAFVDKLCELFIEGQ